MTTGEYKAKIKTLGLTPCRPSMDGATLHQTRDGNFIRIPDPESLSEPERRAALELVERQIILF